MARRRPRPQRSNQPLRPRPSFGGGGFDQPVDAEPGGAAGVLVPEARTELEEIEVRDGPLVAIVIGAESDRSVMAAAGEELKSRNITFEETVISAHRDPEQVRDYARGARMRGIKVIIAGAGLAAALPGVIASYTDLPVIGVPIRSEDAVSGGLDALLSIVQAPSGVPVACVAVNGARNAAILASRILFA
jgi:phosphoribosylaminoimidazole carboxylase PurE protein